MSTSTTAGRGSGGVAFGCPVKGCDGTMYRQKSGELVSRIARPGWVKEERACVCSREGCGHRQTITVQVRARVGGA